MGLIRMTAIRVQTMQTAKTEPKIQGKVSNKSPEGGDGRGGEGA
jgi:hypothetical protein